MHFHSVRFPARLIGSGEPSHTANVIAGFHWLTFKSNKLSTSQVQPTLAHAAPDRGRGRNDRLLGGDRCARLGPGPAPAPDRSRPGRRHPDDPRQNPARAPAAPLSRSPRDPGTEPDGTVEWFEASRFAGRACASNSLRRSRALLH
ncbi:hypothetical protein B2G69_12535 [Methylorubrum zatmanii]|nr:hypothetical protein B2G69_12535 [Methylorubrum zatmanii]